MAPIDLHDREYTAVIDNAVLDASAVPIDSSHADARLSVTITDPELEHATYKLAEITDRAAAA